MSSGQKAWEDECAENARLEAVKKLEQIGYVRIQSVIEELDMTLHLLESVGVSLPRAGWARIDRLRYLLSELR